MTLAGITLAAFISGLAVLRCIPDIKAPPRHKISTAQRAATPPPPKK